jgi:hypothetical protein
MNANAVILFEIVLAVDSCMFLIIDCSKCGTKCKLCVVRPFYQVTLLCTLIL